MVIRYSVFFYSRSIDGKNPGGCHCDADCDQQQSSFHKTPHFVRGVTCVLPTGGARPVRVTPMYTLMQVF